MQTVFETFQLIAGWNK